MSDYTKFNIYRKQMQALGLNAKQYAKLIDMPYEVVKDMIYQKEGEYSMEIGNLLRKDMFKKHQEIESNFDQAKIEAEEIKLQDKKIDPMKWYQEEYTQNMLAKKINSTSTPEFIRRYNIIINGKKPSKWHTYAILSKNQKHLNNVRPEVIEQYVEQLYDIFVNNNDEKYLNTNFESSSTEEKTTRGTTKKYNLTLQEQKKKTMKKQYDWYNNFDFKKYMIENNLTTQQLGEMIGITSYSSASKAFCKRYASLNIVKKLYNYFNNITVVNQSNPIELKSNEVLNPLKAMETQSVDKDNLLRKILIDRLTDQEKELIRIFGGKID